MEGNPVSFLDPFGLEPYDTTNLHTVAAVLGVVAGLVSYMCPGIGLGLSEAAGGFDIGLTLYDGFYHIGDGDKQAIVGDVTTILINLVGIATAGIMFELTQSIKTASNFNGIMDGYLLRLIMEYDKWKNYQKVYNKAAKGWSSYQYLKQFINYLKEKND